MAVATCTHPIEGELDVVEGPPSTLRDQRIHFAPGKRCLRDPVVGLPRTGSTLVEQIKLADATPVIVRAHAEEGFALNAEMFLSAITLINHRQYTFAAPIVALLFALVPASLAGGSL